MNDDRGRGFVLARQERGENDLWTTLLLDDGRMLRALGKGAARSSRRFTAGLSPFVLYRFSFSRARGGGVRLEEASAERVYPNLLTALCRTAAASAASAIARDLGGEVALDEGLYPLYEALLERLERADAAGAGGALVRFTFEAFERSGHPIVLKACVRCGRAVPDNAMVRVNPAAGGVVCSACGGGSLTLRAAERRALCTTAAGDAAAFGPMMLHWLARLIEPNAPRASEALERVTPHWTSKKT